jgi:SAM-dependent methyltransferase
LEGAARTDMLLHAMTTTVAAEEYVAAMSVHESDRRARMAFQGLALQLAAPSSCLLDFGCGPGIDAKVYASHGLSVLAYDVDPRMCAGLAQLCAPELASGAIRLHRGSYREFLGQHVPEMRERYGVELVTANFAPLNLIEDPHELFAALHALTAPNARFLASVLSPNFIGDMKYGWWWAHRAQYLRKGHFSVAGSPFRIFRRSLADFAARAAPYFELTRAVRGLPGARPFALATSRYTFLLFEKR